MSQQIPDYEFSLNQANLTADISSLATVHNKNMKEIEKWIKAIVSQIAQMGGSGQTITNSYFELLLSSNRTVITLEENLQVGDEIVVNGYKLVRINNPMGQPEGSSELRITDTDTERNTNFRKKLVSVMDRDGHHIYPTVRTDTTKASIMFDNGNSLDSIDTNNTNKKIILIS